MKFADKLIPPGDPVTTWRWVIAVAVALTLMNGLSGRGMIAGIGQYANAADVAEQGGKIDRILALQIATALRELESEKCRTAGSKALLERTIEEYQLQYREIVGERYPLPSCEWGQS